MLTCQTFVLLISICKSTGIHTFAAVKTGESYENDRYITLGNISCFIYKGGICLIPMMHIMESMGKLLQILQNVARSVALVSSNNGCHFFGLSDNSRS